MSTFDKVMNLKQPHKKSVTIGKMNSKQMASCAVIPAHCVHGVVCFMTESPHISGCEVQDFITEQTAIMPGVGTR